MCEKIGKKEKGALRALLKRVTGGEPRPASYHFDAWTYKFHRDGPFSCVCACDSRTRVCLPSFWEEELIYGKIMSLDVSSV